MPNNTSAPELSKQLNELRVVYLELIFQLCQRVKDDETERLFLSPVPKCKKRASPFPDTSLTKVVVMGEHLRRRATSPSPLVSTVPQPEAQKWEACLLRAAESRGFHGQGILKAFRNAPASQSTFKTMRILQYICEVANTELLRKIRDIIHEPRKVKESAAHTDRVINLYVRIRKFDKISILAQSAKYKCQLLYYENFETDVFSKKAQMQTEKQKYDVKRMANRRRGLPPPVRGEESGKSGQSADASVRDEYTDKIASQTGLDRVTVRTELNQNLKEGRILSHLLGLRCGRGDRRKLRFILLLPLYGAANPSPALDIMAHHPPEQVRYFSRSFSSREYVLPSL